MLRKIITTKEDATLVLDLPKNLRSRRIEILAFAIDEDLDNNKKMPAGAFAGALAIFDNEGLRKHVEESRSEWDSPYDNR